MKTLERLSAGQLFMMLYISRMVVNVTYSSYSSDVGSLRYGVTASVIAMVITFFMLVPVYFMIRTNKNRNVTDNAFSVFRWLGKAVALIYGLYFLWILINTISFFDIMVKNAANPNTSVFILSLAVVGAAVYAAYKGIEALGRASSLIFIIIVAALIVLIFSLIPEADILNTEPPSMENSTDIMETVFNAIAKNSCIPAMAFLLPLASGNLKRGAVCWVFGVYLSMAVMIFMITAVLGDYLDTQVFPVYTVTAIASLGVTRRLDGIFLGVWTAGMFVKISLFIYLISVCVKRIFGNKAAKLSIILSGAVIVFVSTAVSGTNGIFNLLFDVKLLFIFTMLTGVIIPLVLGVVNIRRKKCSGMQI